MKNLLLAQLFKLFKKKDFPLITKSKLLPCLRCWRDKKTRTERSYW